MLKRYVHKTITSCLTHWFKKLPRLYGKNWVLVIWIKTKDVKGSMKTLCESFTNITNDINKHYAKKSICKIVDDLDENACFDQIIKCKYA